MVLLTGAAIAQDPPSKEIKQAVTARQSLMALFSFNLSRLGEMAKGKIDYDPDLATLSAANLESLARVDQTGLWPDGSSTETLGDMTRALPAIWEDDSRADLRSHADDLAEAAATMKQAAGTDLDSLRANMKQLGDACGACHEDYRASEDEDE